MLAPGYQGSLFRPTPAAGPAGRWRVVEATGKRHAATASLVLAVGQARAVALASGRAWIVADDAEAVEVTHCAADHGAFAVDPCGPGWPATARRILARTGEEDAPRSVA